MKPLPPVTKRSNVGLNHNTDTDLSDPSGEDTVHEQESAAVESDPPPPVKKLKAQLAWKTAMISVNTINATETRQKAALSVEEVVMASNEEMMADEELCKESKPKKAKLKVQDQINVATKKLGNEIQTNDDMMRSMSSQEIRRSESRRPASTGAPHLTKRLLKREGAIADINALYQQDVWKPDLSSKCRDDTKLMR